MFRIALVGLLALALPLFAQKVVIDKPNDKPEPNPVAEAIQDEIELLEAQLAVKQAGLKAAEGKQASAERAVKRLDDLGNGVAQIELGAARALADAGRGEVLIRTAEVKEVEVKIKVAKRRLERTLAAANVPSREVSPAMVLEFLLAMEKDQRSKEEKQKLEAAKQMEERKKAEAEARFANLVAKLEAIERELEGAKMHIKNLEATKNAVTKELEKLKTDR